MNDRIKSKRVGRVNICELYGDFKDGFARRGKAVLTQLAQGQNPPDLLLNLRELDRADAFGAAVLAESSALFRKKALLLNPATPKENLDIERLTQKFHRVSDAADAAEYFSREFAELQPGAADGEERRGFVRLPVILPARFQQHGGSATAPHYFSVVTNLSEGGLYAEFIESDVEAAATKSLDPLELILLDLRLALAPDVVVEAGAKVIHVKQGEGGIGMEFYRFKPGDKEKLMDWLARQLESSQVVSKAPTG